MATLTIRNVPEEVRDRLRVRAARNRRSMEAEVRAVLGAAVDTDGVQAMATAGRQVKRTEARIEAALPPAWRRFDDSLADSQAAAGATAGEGRPASRLSQAEKLKLARAILRRYVPEGTPLVDEFLAERRAMWGEE